jgi:hypothetical protein
MTKKLAFPKKGFLPVRVGRMFRQTGFAPNVARAKKILK